MLRARWWRNRPLRTRISILLIVLFNGVLTVTSIVTFSVLRSSLYKELDHRLTTTTAGMATADSAGVGIGARTPPSTGGSGSAVICTSPSSAATNAPAARARAFRIRRLPPTRR